MTVCGRSCCWTPFSCGTNYDCRCHWPDKRPAPERGNAYTHRDPTANEAIRRAMKGKKHK